MVGRRAYDRPEPAWRQVVRAWPLVLATLTIIAFIVNAQRDIAQLKQEVVTNGARIQTINARTDSLAKGAEIRDYMICKVFETLVKENPSPVNIPKRCDDVFQGWGTR